MKAEYPDVIENLKEEIERIALALVGSKPSKKQKLSKEAKEILRNGGGYRCEGSLSRSTKASEVLRFEIDELGNDHILTEIMAAFGLPKTPTTEEAISLIERRFGVDAKVLWLATQESVKRYCDEGEEPEYYDLPGGAVIISDLDAEGQLFLFS